MSAQVKVRRHRERDTLLHEQEEINTIKAQSLKMETRSIFCADFGGTNRFYRMELKIVKYMTFNGGENLNEHRHESDLRSIADEIDFQVT